MDYPNGTEIVGNAREILRLLFQHEQLTRKRLAEITGLSTLTIAKATKAMIESGIVMESDTIDSQKGRKPQLLAVCPDYGYVIGIDIGAYATKIGVVSFNGALVEKQLFTLADPMGIPGTVLSIDALLEQIGILMQRHQEKRCLGIGVGISGLVDYVLQTSIFCPNITGYNRLGISKLLRERFQVQALIDTSARCMALGEMYFGRAKGFGDVSFISVGYSVAVGTIIGNQMFRGFRGFAGEMGHMKVTSDKDAVCTCGSSGCVELYVTLPMVYANFLVRLRDYRGYGVLKDRYEAAGDISYQDIADAYLAGDKLAIEVLGQTVEYLAIVIANYVNLFNPVALALGGGFFDVFPFLGSEIERSIQQKGLTPSLQDLKIFCSEMAEDSAIIGSAMQIIQSYFNSTERR